MMVDVKFGVYSKKKRLLKASSLSSDSNYCDDCSYDENNGKQTHDLHTKTITTEMRRAALNRRSNNHLAI